MELEVGTDDIMRDSYYEIADADDIDDDDATGCQNEKCGICMDIIIDRGVLDCCHHWFCFACIDNWATITNLCPLCQNEFQLITCVPVYDTIGTPKVDDEALSRDDDWFIRGTNNTLSFPSYYIDENAVICLDGDDCKIRSGMARSEDDSNLDTSIACDSCDKWYHAFCVRFDPESTSENSWLCPRCQFDEAPQKSDGALLHSPRNKIVSKTAGYECTTEGALSGKLSVSVVDTGETAVVVSMIEGKQWVEEASEDFQCEIHEAPQNLDGALPHFSRNNIGSKTVGHERITDGALSGKLSVSVAGTGETADVVSMIEGNKWVEEASEDFQSEIDVAPQNSDGILLDSPKNKIGPETVGLERTTECVLSGKLSVSVADTRERTFTISTVEGMQMVEEVSGDFLSGLDIDKDGQSINGKNDIQPNVESKEILLQASFSEDMHATLSSDPLPLGELKTACPDKAVTVPSGSAHSKIPAGLLSTIPDTNTNTNTNIKPLEIKSNVDQHISLFVGSSLSVDNMSCEETENHISAMSQLHNSSKESSSSGNEMGNGEARICGAPQLHKPSKESLQVDTMEADVEDATGYIGVKRKSTSSRVPVTRRDRTPLTEDNENDSIYAEETMVVEFCAKKAKAESNSQKPHVKHETRKGGTRELNCLPDDSELSDVQQKEDATSDIMSIVRGNYHRPSHVSVTPPDKPLKGRDKGSGLRVKKIMRRAAEDESSKVVENLRKEIKEAVRNKDVSKSKFFDPKLLAAFRTAVAGPKAEQEQLRRLNPSVVRAKKSMLMKGKARENLTKKIYGTTNGRRRRAWDREWEIEFWKHRCMRITQPEKVETLKSVLDLLRRGSKSSGMEQKLDAEGANPILSRLYLADTSVFPRKDDIKPLSDLTSRGTGEVNNERNLKEKVSQSKNDLGIACPPTHTKTVPRFSFSPSDKVERGDALDLKGETASTTAHSNCSTATKSSTSMLSGSKVDLQQMKEIPGKSDVKSDKRKWALEVLARKTAAVESRTQRKQEDPNLLNGNFPLLAQLPTDMRPVLAPSRHNKVSIPVRQTQLYRLTEHLLRKANLAVIRRTADTEFAVADAVNIEKDVVDRSNSKLVYVNLCSQVLAKHMNSNSTISATESNPSTERATTEPSSDLSAEEALRMAGLMSDSPPSSPQTEHINDVKNSSIMAGEDVPDNVLDMDSHGDMDLEDEEYIGDNSLKISREQKLVFSTINKERADEKLEISKAPPDCLELEKGSDLECSAFEAREDASCLQVDPLQGKRDEQYSELYGLADKEARCGPDTTGVRCEFVDAGNTSVSSRLPTDHRSSGGDQNQEARANKTNESSDISRCVYKKVEAYIKEHIRPLCKSGVITVDQYRWAVGKTCEKIMKYHSKDKNANFLIKEGEKVKKLAEQYVEAAQKRLEES